MSKAASRWYCIRTIPGSQRMAPAFEIANGGLDAEAKMAENERRRGESIVERNLRNEGIDVYMPAFWTMVRHQRTNRVIEKRFPMLIGYAFVHLPRLEFEQVRGVDGVMCFLRNNRDDGPMWFGEQSDIWPLMKAEWEAKTEYLADKERKLDEAKKAHRNRLNKQLGALLPKGRKRRISMRYHAENCIDSLSPEMREQVLGILTQLDGLDNHEGLANLALAG